MIRQPSPDERVPSGIAGLDAILRSGFVKSMLYLVHGVPGAGKTTLCLQFLLEGIRRGERVLLASLLQTERDLELLARSHHWSLDNVRLIGLPKGITAALTDAQSLFSPADIELPKVTDVILRSIGQHKPQRLVFDSISELALLVDSGQQLQRQVLRLKQRIDELDCTTLFTFSESHPLALASLETLAHGVVELGVKRVDYGPPGRWLEVTKMRGLEFLEGRHDYRIRSGGLEVHPRTPIVAEARRRTDGLAASGNSELDRLLGGGLLFGSTCLITGTPGAGKSALGALYVHAAARRGERSTVFCFDDRRDIYMRRADSLGLDLGAHEGNGLVEVRQVGVGEMSPGEFACRVRDAVDGEKAKVLVIDSLIGYLNAMQREQGLVPQLHDLLRYVAGAGALTLLIAGLGQKPPSHAPWVENSFLADAILMVRGFDSDGLVRRSIGVIKKRYGAHEQSIREMTIGRHGITVGPPLHQFHGLLTDQPQFTGRPESLLEEAPGTKDGERRG